MAKKEPTERQKAHYQRLKQLREARAAGNRADQLVADSEMEESGPAPDDILARLAAALTESGQTRKEKNQRLDDVAAVIGRLSAADYPDLAKNPVVQQFLELMGERTAELHPDDPPGTIYNRGQLGERKKIWQWGDLPKYGFRDPTCREKGSDCPNCGGHATCVETVMITPNEARPITWNGLSIQIAADVEQWIPRPHYEVYRETIRARETARQHADYMFRKRDNITGNADPSVIGAGSVMMRGRGDGHTGYRPGAGGFNPFEPEGAAAGGEGGGGEA